MADDNFILENAPLAEVVAEVHWELKPLSMPPEAMLDPYYSDFAEDFSRWAMSNGFPHLEQLVPQEFPVELLPNKPHRRLRRVQNGWPLFHIGPGLLTANIGPPYLGWKDFRPCLQAGLAALMKTYPIADRLLRLKKLELRYLNFFELRHGMDDYARFVANDLKFQAPFNLAILDGYRSPKSSPVLSLISEVEVDQPKSSRALIQLNKARRGQEEAALLQLTCIQEGQGKLLSEVDAMDWFEQSHVAIREWFMALTPQALKDRVGPKVGV
jgi:uncharacterized protein (TIGR04255 family)